MAKQKISIEQTNIAFPFEGVDATLASQQLIDMSPFSAKSIALQIVAAGIVTADAVVTIEESNDNVNWVTAKDDAGADASFPLAAGANNIMSRLNSAHARYLRINFDEGTNSGGTFSTYLFLKH